MYVFIIFIYLVFILFSFVLYLLNIVHHYFFNGLLNGKLVIVSIIIIFIFIKFLADFEVPMS